jgi:hypothetical protein
MTKSKIKKPSALAKTKPSYAWRNRPDFKKNKRTEMRKSMNVALRILDILDKRKVPSKNWPTNFK